MDSQTSTLAGEKEGRSVSPTPSRSLHKEVLVEKNSFDNVPTDMEDGSTKDTPVVADADEGEYPEGFRLAMIVVALLLSIFLVLPLLRTHSTRV